MVKCILYYYKMRRSIAVHVNQIELFYKPVKRILEVDIDMTAEQHDHLHISAITAMLNIDYVKKRTSSKSVVFIDQSSFPKNMLVVTASSSSQILNSTNMCL